MDWGIVLARQGGVRRDPQHPQGPSSSPWSLFRLSEQTLLVEKLSEQKEEGERCILALKADIQRLVCGVGTRVLSHGCAFAWLRALCSQKSRRSGGQMVADELRDEIDVLHHVLASIKEVWFSLFCFLFNVFLGCR